MIPFSACAVREQFFDLTVSQFSLQFKDILVDYSKNIITEETMKLLLALAEQQKVPDVLSPSPSPSSVFPLAVISSFTVLITTLILSGPSSRRDDVQRRKDKRDGGPCSAPHRSPQPREYTDLRGRQR